jgi:hypothetical protein
MFKHVLTGLVWLSLLTHSALAQGGIIKGRLFNDLSNEPLPFGTVRLQGTDYGTYTDSSGGFEIRNLPPGLYNVEARYTGFEPAIIFEVQATNSKPYVLEIGLREGQNQADSVEIVASPFKQVEEAPLSLRTIGTAEIKRNPGGNRDISRVIQSLPGVASTVSFRNDILIRGGAPNENRFYIDGIETPNINHFATQGASGGPVGLINVDFIGEVDFYSGAFPANRGNALSSVFEFTQRPARDDRLGVTATVGSSDLALTVEGPSGENSAFLFSVRRSYLQLLFRVLALPFLPNYNDYQYKHKFRFGERHELNIVSLGAIDQFALNLEADSTDFQRYTLNNLPVQTQWNYTIGANYKYFGDKGFWQVVASRNMINYRAYKYAGNDEENGDQLLDYQSQEIENKLRVEYTGRRGGFKYNVGANYEYAKFSSDLFQVLPFTTLDFASKLGLNKYGAFVQLSQRLFSSRLTLALGARIDGNDFSETMRNPLTQASPRFSASVGLTPQVTFNVNTGIYYQLPPYTVLGYRNTGTGNLENLAVTYIQNRHAVAGFAYTSDRNLRISVEGYYKRYYDYPFLLRDSISLANLGGDFGAIGNEPATSSSEGRAYGLELLVQQRLFKGFYGIIAYTLGVSKFTNADGSFVPSAWDQRHILTLTAGKKFGKTWELGLRWRFTSGSPYTPADTALSSLRAVWDSRGATLPDYKQLNTQRLDPFHQLDVRLDKKWFFKKWSLNLFIDIQNIYQLAIPGPPLYDVVRDDERQPVVNPNDPSRYLLRQLDNEIGIFQPTLGIVVTY